MPRIFRDLKKSIGKKLRSPSHSRSGSPKSVSSDSSYESTPVTTGLVSGEQLYHRILAMAELIDLRVKSARRKNQQFNEKISFSNFSLLQSRSEGESVVLDLPEDNAEGLSNSARNNFCELAIIVITSVIKSAQFKDEAYANSLLADIKLLKEMPEEKGLSIQESIMRAFEKSRKDIHNSERRRLYEKTHELIRKVYESYPLQASQDDEIRKQIEQRGPLTDFDYEARFSSLRNATNTENRFAQMRKMLSEIAVTPSVRVSATSSDLSSETTHEDNISESTMSAESTSPFQSFINLRESFANGLKCCAEDISKIAKGCDRRSKAKLDKIKQQLNTLADQFLQRVELYPDELNENIGKDYEEWLKDILDKLQAINNSVKSAPAYEAICSSVQALSLQAAALNDQAAQAYNTAIESYNGTIGLAKNLVGRIDHVIETDMMSYDEKELYIKIIVLGTVENWINPERRYQGDKNQIFGQCPQIEALKKDLEMLKAIASFSGLRNGATQSEATTAMKLLANSFDVNRCFDLAQNKYLSASRAISADSQELEAMEENYSQVMTHISTMKEHVEFNDKQEKAEVTEVLDSIVNVVVKNSALTMHSVFSQTNASALNTKNVVDSAASMTPNMGECA